MYPSLYKCEVCGNGLDPKASTVLKLITGWAKGSSNTVKYIEENHFRFIHEACKSRPPQTETLF